MKIQNNKLKCENEVLKSEKKKSDGLVKGPYELLNIVE